ncbi:hypothetical protein D3C84_1248650 [compost metagenome]
MKVGQRPLGDQRGHSWRVNAHRDDVRCLAFFQGAYLLVHAQGARAVDGCHAAHRPGVEGCGVEAGEFGQQG